MSFLKSIVKGVGNLLTGGMLAANDARKSEQRAAEVRSKIEGRQIQRDRAQALREAQIARATGMQAAVTSGSADSSGFAGAQAGMQATALGNVAFSQQVETGVGMINMYQRTAARQQMQAQNWAAVKQLATQAVSAGMSMPSGSGVKGFTKAFVQGG